MCEVKVTSPANVDDYVDSYLTNGFISQECRDTIINFIDLLERKGNVFDTLLNIPYSADKLRMEAEDGS